MDRIEYAEARLQENEVFVARDHNVKLYDGDNKTQFENGEVVLTTHRLFWGRPGEIARAAVTLCLQLKYVLSVAEETASSYVFGRKTRLIVHLRQPATDKAPGPVNSTNASYIKLSGRNGLCVDFNRALRETVEARIWEVLIATTHAPNTSLSAQTPISGLRIRTGIGGIQRSLEDKQKQTDENIALAFQDLNVLMAMAKDMVNISKAISSKIRAKNGEISDDETVRFKSYLLSLGIEDPVTREHFTTNTEYFRTLAQQICEMMLDPIEACGGMMALADVYCRVNRARGLELLSPEDLLQACRQLDGPIRLRTFPSGAVVLQLESQDDELIATQTLAKVEDATSLAVEELAKDLNISILLAKERLLTAERLGKVCRDETVEGLRFYPNLILNSKPGSYDETV